jgi:hypothetical protein
MYCLFLDFWLECSTDICLPLYSWMTSPLLYDLLAYNPKPLTLQVDRYVLRDTYTSLLENELEEDLGVLIEASLNFPMLFIMMNEKKKLLNTCRFFFYQSFFVYFFTVSCVSFNQLEQHKQGKKHKQLERKACDVKNLENLLDSLELNTTDDKRYPVKKGLQTAFADDFDCESIIHSPTSIVSNSPTCSPSHALTGSPVKKNRKKSRLNLYCGNCGSKQASLGF